MGGEEEMDDRQGICDVASHVEQRLFARLGAATKAADEDENAKQRGL